MYVFDSWTATNAATGKSKTVKTNLYEDVADADYTVKANFKPLKVSCFTLWGTRLSQYSHTYATATASTYEPNKHTRTSLHNNPTQQPPHQPTDPTSTHIHTHTNKHARATASNLLTRQPPPKKKVTNDRAMAAPAGVEVLGEFKRLTVNWEAPEGAEPDYVIVNVKKVCGCVCRCLAVGV